jgi:hypothetical protein
LFHIVVVNVCVAKSMDKPASRSQTCAIIIVSNT